MFSNNPKIFIFSVLIQILSEYPDKFLNIRIILHVHLIIILIFSKSIRMVNPLGRAGSTVFPNLTANYRQFRYHSQIHILYLHIRERLYGFADGASPCNGGFHRN